MHEVDDHEIDFLLEQLIVLSLSEDNRNQKYIEDVL